MLRLAVEEDGQSDFGSELFVSDDEPKHTSLNDSAVLKQPDLSALKKHKPFGGFTEDNKAKEKWRTLLSDSCSSMIVL